METVDVPLLAGQTRDEARDTLVAAGLQLGLVSQEPSDQPQGTVIRSTPAAGTTVRAGSQVDIVLSAGPTPTPTPVPVPYTHLRAHETRHELVCRLLLEKKKSLLPETLITSHKSDSDKPVFS